MYLKTHRWQDFFSPEQCLQFSLLGCIKPQQLPTRRRTSLYVAWEAKSKSLILSSHSCESTVIIEGTQDEHINVIIRSQLLPTASWEQQQLVSLITLCSAFRIDRTPLILDLILLSKSVMIQRVSAPNTDLQNSSWACTTAKQEVHQPKY